jgi:hypothetical protein
VEQNFSRIRVWKEMVFTSDGSGEDEPDYPLSSALAAEATTALASAAKASPFFCILGMHD